MTERFHRLFADLPAPDPASADAVRTRAEQVLRPAGALRRLDDAAVHVAAWRGTTRPTVGHPAILVFAGDHGVVADLAEVAVMCADGQERLWRGQADHFVGFGLQPV